MTESTHRTPPPATSQPTTTPRGRALSVIQQVTRLPHQPLDELRQLWQALFGTPAPTGSSRKTLVAPLAYRLQELAFGGLSDRHQRQLSQLAHSLKNGRPLAHALKPPTKPTLAAGTRLIRDYRGVSHEVRVTDNGFVYDGQPYRSLSAIATRITGTRWNGWVFFGLKKPSPTETRV